MIKKIIFTAAIALTGMSAVAQTKVFNHLGFDLGVGTNGISVEAATPITDWVTMRAGVSIMPGIKFSADVDADYEIAGQTRSTTVDLDGNLGRVQGQVIFNVYPAPKVPFYVALGGYFGGSKLVKIKGHSADLEGALNSGVIIGDQVLPVDAHGNVKGGIKVKGFRPYVGIGWGRAIPKKLVNFNIDLGVQIHGTPKLYTDNGEISPSLFDDDDNTFQKIMDKVKVYPTLTFRIGFRAF